MRTKHPDFEDTYLTQPGGLKALAPKLRPPAPVVCPPCTGNCEQGDVCPHRMQPQPAEAATAVGHTEPRSAWSRSAWLPAVNVFLIVAAFCIAAALAIFKANKPAVVVALCVLLPLVVVSVVGLLARWKAGA